MRGASIRVASAGALLLACAAFCPAEETAETTIRKTEPVVRSAFFALSTGDADRLIKWYCQNLGFTVVASRRTPAGVRGALLSRPGALLEVLQLPTAKPREATSESVHGILKIGFEVADLDSLYSIAVQKHLTVFFAPTKPADNPLRTFALKDPDGNIVQFFGK